MICTAHLDAWQPVAVFQAGDYAGCVVILGTKLWELAALLTKSIRTFGATYWHSAAMGIAAVGNYKAAYSGPQLLSTLRLRLRLGAAAYLLKQLVDDRGRVAYIGMEVVALLCMDQLLSPGPL